ncbi:uncharacterized protein LOC132712867 [Ruditapes philippinarum]|uniref:uncharacterized protein LOC132712867 n=1 Tax=Ruditapes philippinarum TaxID=129788 RepID=UPI00295B0D6A|nr:uncharacterized protein LOC132712867 [Ruditapes philippinarum]
MCSNWECRAVNLVSYGTTHHNKTNGKPCFEINTKLGFAMIDSIGGAVKVNNFLATLDLKLISLENLKEMERRAGEVIEALSAESQRRSAEEAYKKEMEDIAKEEIQESRQKMEEADGIEDLGVWLPPDSSPLLR